MRANLLMLGFFLVACAGLFAPPEVAVETPSPVWSVDGVSLGMTADQVRAAWGDVVVGESVSGVRTLHKGVSIACLDEAGQICSVYGRRARYGTRSVVAVGDNFERRPQDWDWVGGCSHRLMRRQLSAGEDVLDVLGEDELISLDPRYPHRRPGPPKVVALSLYRKAAAPPEVAVETPSPMWSVDGVSLGMTADQVRAAWGDLEESSLSDGLRCLRKPGRVWDGTNFAWFDPEGRVHCVTGHRLRRGQQLLVSTGMDFDPIELGQPTPDPRISMCATGEVMRDKWFQLESDVLVQVEGLSLESVELPPGTDRAKILAVHPQFGRVSAVTLRRRELRSLLSEAPPWSSARK